MKLGPMMTDETSDLVEEFKATPTFFSLASNQNSLRMVPNDLATIANDIASPDMQKFLQEATSHANNVGELRNALEVLSKVDMTLASSSEKLANIENHLLLVLAGENEVEAIDIENDDISSKLIEKAFAFELLYAILNFELNELDNLMSDLQDQNVDALRKLSTSEHSMEALIGVVNKLHDSEELLKQSRERVLEMKIQLAKLKMTSFSSEQHEWKNGLVMDVKQELHLASMERKPEMQITEQRRSFRMLERSLARELELEKKLMEFKQNEEDLKLKIRLTEQVAGCIEEAAEIAWSRFLVADNTAEVLMGISQEMLGKLQNGQLNLHSSTKREEETNCNLQNCITQLSAKETPIDTLKSRVGELITDNAEVIGLKEKVQMLEEKLKISESRLAEANASSEVSQQQLREMEGETESLREKICATENRAESAETKAMHLTDSNLELTEELDFLKGSNDSKTKKVTILEKQLKELDVQFQHARASSEASQEQQNMLYSAILDMELLIDELKRKVSQAESRAESAEGQRVVLSETNLELHKEIELLRSRLKFMERSLNQATLEKKSCAEDISTRTHLMMDSVMQLTLERERIQKQLFSITKENKLLREKLQKEQRHAPVILPDNGSCDEEDFLLSGPDSADSETTKTSAVKDTKISLERYQADKSLEDASLDKNETGSTRSTKHGPNLARQLEADQRLDENGNNHRRTTAFVFVAILAVLLSTLAGHLLHGKTRYFRRLFLY